MTSPGRPEVLVIGRVSVDMYPEQIGRPLAEVSTFRSAVGGSSANVAVAAARLGHRSALLTKVGDDPLGRFVRAALERLGVDTSWVSTHPGLATPVVFAELDPPSDPTIWFYRQPSAPDEHLSTDDIDPQLVRTVPILWIPGSVMAFERSAAMVTAAMADRGRRTHTVVDLDYRPMFWSAPEEARRAVVPLLDHATVIVGNREECQVVVGTADPTEAARRLLTYGADLAIVKRGADGVLAVRSDGESVEVAPTPVDVVCGLGSGDAFGGSVIHGLLAGSGLEQMLIEANAAGAIVASRLACSDDMPTRAEIELMLATGTPPVRTIEEHS